jgi:uncharacterized protein (TIGR02453 family)
MSVTKDAHFEGFPAGLFQFLRQLADNNSRDWFNAHRHWYDSEVLRPVKAFVGELGQIVRMLNPELETEPRVGRTISRISNHMRFQKSRFPYRPFIYVGFPRRGARWTQEALLYVGIYHHGVSAGFYPGGYRQLRTSPIQEGIKKNLRLFQRYLTERRIAERYFELTGGEQQEPTRWPLPKTARQWVKLESFTVGEYFPSSDVIGRRRAMLDSVQQILLDLYPLWLFAQSDDLKEDFDLYCENAQSLARPLTRAAD